VREDREHRATRGALETPEGDPTQTDPEVMRVARQPPTSATGRLVLQLKAAGQEEGQPPFETRLAIVKQVRVSRFIVYIDGDGAVVPRPCGGCAHMCHPQVIRSRQLMRHAGSNTVTYQDHREGFRTLPRNSVECDKRMAVWFSFFLRQSKTETLMLDSRVVDVRMG
jgi:hypothetical protein